jgi:diacylglycerol kinase
MTINFVGIFFFIALLVLLAAVSIWVERRSARIEEDSRDVARAVDARDLPPEVSEFLSALDGRLDMPAAVRAEIRLELADHLEDSIAAIEAEGLDRDRATREALARLGQPEDLAAQLRHAHQTTRRLLAGAAGGVFQAGLGVVWGAVLGYVAMLLVIVVFAILLNTALKPLVDLAASHLPNISTESQDLAANSAFGAAVLLFPAFLAARFGARACARMSRRSIRTVGLVWAGLGLLGIGYVVLFVDTAQ